METFQFLRPVWLLALPVGGLLAWRLKQLAGSPVTWRRVCDPDLLPHLLVEDGRRADRWPYWLLAAGWVVATLALAGPTWDRQRQPVYRSLAGRVIVLDVSKSMDAADLSPSRLIQARFKVADLLNRPFDGQYGLVVFAGDAFTVSPLTHDVGTLRNLLGALDTNVVPVQGSSARRGLEHAERLLAQSGARGGHIVLITDEADPSALDTAERLREQQIRTHVLGVGTPQGGAIPLADGGFFKDSSGAIVLPRLDVPSLQRLARAGGGEFATVTVDDSDVERLSTAMRELPGAPGAMTDTRLETERFNDRGPWLVLALLPFAALAFRRGWLTVALLVFWASPAPVQALSWESLWWRADQRAARALSRGDAERAAAEHAAPDWQGSALYREERYDDAEQAFLRTDDVANHYNRGNALARQGELEQAIDAYDAALSLQPDFDDATYNREVVMRALQQQPPTSDQDPQQSDSGENSQGEPPPADDNSAADPESTTGDSADPSSQRHADGEQNASPARDPQADGEAAEPEGSPSPQRPEQTTDAGGESPASPTDTPGQQQTAAPGDEMKEDPEDPEIEQWLRRIPDDPGGLLRRKFRLQYARREDRAAAGEKTW